MFGQKSGLCSEVGNIYLCIHTDVKLVGKLCGWFGGSQFVSGDQSNKPEFALLARGWSTAELKKDLGVSHPARLWTSSVPQILCCLFFLFVPVTPPRLVDCDMHQLRIKMHHSRLEYAAKCTKYAQCTIITSTNGRRVGYLTHTRTYLYTVYLYPRGFYNFIFLTEL